MIVNGRYGPYQARKPADLAKARRQEVGSRSAANTAADWLERNRWCKAGCGQPAAMWEDSPVSSLRYSSGNCHNCERAANPTPLPGGT